MAFGFGFGLPRGGNTIWSPASLFAQNEPGVWYDPSDMTTLFQDAQGTTPVTAVEQPVGLMLDKSRGLVLGSELVTNGDFSQGSTGWGTFAGSIAVSGGEATLTANAGAAFPQITQTINGLTVGRTYLMTGTARRGTTVDNVFISPVSGTSVQTSSTSATALRITFVAAATSVAIGLGIFSASTNGTAVFDNISVRELPGVHASSLTTSRPVLTARVNQLTKTEQFNDAVWTKSNATVTANTIIAPDGTLTADTLVRGANTTTEAICRISTTQAINTAQTISVYVKAGTAGAFLYLRNLAVNDTLPNGLVVFNPATGLVASTGSAYTSATMQPVGDNWYKCIVTGTTPASIVNNVVDIGVCNGSGIVTGNAGASIYIWGASLTTTDQASLGYQRVNTATDYDTVGFPMWLKADGVDDYMVTGTLAAPVNLDLTSTDKVTVATGVRKLGDSTGIISELSAAPDSTNGVFSSASVVGGAYFFRSKGTIAADLTPSGFAVPITNTLTGLGNISGDVSTLRINGTQAATSAADQGTGNYGSYPLYQFRRAGTSLPFNGLSAGLTVVGRTLTAAELSQLETYYQQKTKAY